MNNAKLEFSQMMSYAVNQQEGEYLALMLATSADEHKHITDAIKFLAGAYADAKTGLNEVLGLSKPTDAESATQSEIRKNAFMTTVLYQFVCGSTPCAHSTHGSVHCNVQYRITCNQVCWRMGEPGWSSQKSLGPCIVFAMAP